MNGDILGGAPEELKVVTVPDLDRTFELEVRMDQLRTRGEGDLITCLVARVVDQ